MKRIKFSSILTSSKHKIAVSTILVVILLIAFALVPPVVAEGQTQSTDTSFHNVTVDLAYDMITNGSFPDLVILDVRDQYEYAMGHLYDAVLIPHDELETRIGELEEHKNHEIIVYCGSGGRSQIASEILANHSFTKVYNMLGAIPAWIEAGYPIYTTYHHVTVNTVDEEILLQIEPLLLLQTGCASCGQNHTCPSDSELNITSTVLEENETHTVILLTYEVNGTTFELTVVNTLLWSYNELTDEINRTASFISTLITVEDTSMQFYGLSYLVQHAEYNLNLSTNLAPLNSETYNASFTIMNYAPADKTGLSLEFVEFNSSVTLSKLYAVLGEVAKEIGKVYEKSGDETLAQLAQGYYTMEEEAKDLSKLVEQQLQEYDKEILQSSAILMDACNWLGVVFCALTEPEVWLSCGVLCACVFVFPPWCIVPCLVCVLGMGTIITLCLILHGCLEYALTIQAGTGGTTSPSPGTYTYFMGTIVTVTAYPNLNYYFDYWTLDGNFHSYSRSTTVDMNSDHVLKAYFRYVGCVAEGTPITMSDGSVKLVEKVRKRDQVLGFDPVTGSYTVQNVLEVAKSSVETMVYLNNGMLKLTPLDQPVFIRNSTYEGWVRNPQEIEVGWEIYNVTSHGWVPVTSVTIEEGTARVYELVLDGNKTFIANGLLLMDKC